MIKNRYATQETPQSWEVFDQLFDTAYKKKAAGRPLEPAVVGGGERDHLHASQQGHNTRNPSEAWHWPDDLLADDDFPDYASDVSSSSGPPTPPDYEYIDQIWAEVRRFKQRELAKEKSKIKSLEASGAVDASGAVRVPSREAPRSPQAPPPAQAPGPNINVRPIIKFRASTTNTSMTAIFDMAGVPKKDVHISFQAHRLVVNWSVTRDFDGRGPQSYKYSKAVSMPIGTKFEHIHAGMDGHFLMVRYPMNKDEVNRNEAVEPIRAPLFSS